MEEVGRLGKGEVGCIVTLGDGYDGGVGKIGCELLEDEEKVKIDLNEMDIPGYNDSFSSQVK